MAVLRTSYMLNMEDLDLNWFSRKFDTHRLDHHASAAGPDRYALQTVDETLTLKGDGFGMGGGHLTGGMVHSANVSIWNYYAFDWLDALEITGFSVSARRFHDAMQSEGKRDDFGLMRAILSKNDKILLSDEADKMHGFRGNDMIRGHAGDDEIWGDLGNDLVYGGKGQDRLHGGTGDDTVLGAAGRDLLRGGKGEDLLRGGSGRDTLVGGEGADTFAFKTGDAVEIVADFNTFFLDHDMIDFSALQSITGWRDLVKNHMSQEGDDVVIDGGNGDVMILRNIEIEYLVKQFFEF